MATYPLPKLSASITATGVSYPPYTDVLESLKASFRIIYGVDAYLEPDSQDGQLLAVFAKAIDDCNQATAAVYNSFAPSRAQGEGLSSVVKINNLTRAVATKSQVNLTLVGQAGTVVVNGKVADLDGQRWLLPASVTIPFGGSVIATATAEQAGALFAAIGTVTQIITPTAGWQSVSNASAATPGNPVETDAELRRRQEVSPALNAYTVAEGLIAALRALSGVTYVKVYENATGLTDGNGMAPHSIGCVVKGGVASAVADAIFKKKSLGVLTEGTTAVNVTDISGTARPVKFYIPTNVPIKIALTVEALPGYVSTIGVAIKQALLDHVAALDVGEDVLLSRLYAPALLMGKPDSETYRITVLQVGLVSGSLGTSDLTIGFVSQATLVLVDITLTVV